MSLAGQHFGVDYDATLGPSCGFLWLGWVVPERGCFW